MWSTISTIFTTLYATAPMFTIIFGSLILIFLGGMSFITKVNISKFKNADLKNEIMKNYLLDHLAVKEQINKIDRMSFTIHSSMMGCFDIAYPTASIYQRKIYELAVKDIMFKVRDSILKTLKEPDFFKTDFELLVPIRMKETKDIVDSNMDEVLPEFIKGLDSTKLKRVLVNECQETIFNLLKEMFTICKEVYEEYHSAGLNIDDKIMSSIKVYS